MRVRIEYGIFIESKDKQQLRLLAFDPELA